jgi:hypothetical protein
LAWDIYLCDRLMTRLNIRHSPVLS